MRSYWLGLVCACSSASDLPMTDASAPADASTTGSEKEAGLPRDASVDAHTADMDATHVGTSDTGIDASFGCAGSPWLLCEDFESGSLNATTWKSETNTGGTIAVDSKHAHSGQFALHLHISLMGGTEADITTTKTFPTLSHHLFGRAMIFINTATPNTHVDLARAAGSPQDYSSGIQFQELSALSDGSAGEENGGHAKADLATGAWSCLEWEFNGQGGSANYWLNGTALTFDGLTQWTPTTFSSFVFGQTLYGDDTGPSGGYDFWYDDLALDSARIGCQ